MTASGSSDLAADLMDRLGLSEDELCQILDTDALTLLSGQLERTGTLKILLDLLQETETTIASASLRAWVRAVGSGGRPVDALLRRDFAAFEDALAELEQHGFVLRARRNP